VTLLLETHALIWLVAPESRLGGRAWAAVGSGDVRVSAISVWEVAIKRATGRLQAPELDRVLQADDFPEPAFSAEHARVAGVLPAHHCDPFDRTLVAQARIEGMVLVTADPQLSSYDVAVLDASG
jgi:PIN domain nuclease of toxin-antitoxin system